MKPHIRKRGHGWVCTDCRFKYFGYGATPTEACTDYRDHLDFIAAVRNMIRNPK